MKTRAKPGRCAALTPPNRCGPHRCELPLGHGGNHTAACTRHRPAVILWLNVDARPSHLPPRARPDRPHSLPDIPAIRALEGKK